jgi:hypothetical protein
MKAALKEMITMLDDNSCGDIYRQKGLSALVPILGAMPKRNKIYEIETFIDGVPSNCLNPLGGPDPTFHIINGRWANVRWDHKICYDPVDEGRRQACEKYSHIASLKDANIIWHIYVK